MKDGKIGLPRVVMIRDAQGNPAYARDDKNYVTHEQFKLAEDYPLNEGWVLRQFGLALTLVHENDLTLTILMGSWDEGSDAYGLATSGGDDEVAAVQDKFLYDDVPNFVNKEDLPAVVEQFFNHMIFETLEAYVPTKQLDTSSHVTV